MVTQQHPHRPFGLAARPLAVTLATGTAGGALVTLLDVPLAWLIGAMAATILLGLAGGKPHLPNTLRAVMVAILGVMIGSAFRPEIVNDMTSWWTSVPVMLGFVGLASAVTFFYLRKVEGFDHPTAFFASTPGGMGEMTLMGDAFGGDARVISIIHAFRVGIVVGAVPIIISLSGGAGESASQAVPAALSPPSMDMIDVVILGSCIALGWPLAAVIGMPAASFAGPMVISALAHLIGLSYASPPQILVTAAQIVLGIAIGLRFAEGSSKGLGRVAIVATCLAAGVVTAAAILGWALAPILGIDRVELILALAPGGVAEMSLVALSIGVGTAYISAMHIVRIGLIVTILPFVYRYASDRRPPGS